MVPSSAGLFYGRLSAELDRMRFGDHVRRLCKPFYDQSGRGHPGVDPEVFFRMLMVGFFENLSSERAIAERCADSIKIRVFLGYTFQEKTPDHSTLCRFRQRIAPEVFAEVFEQMVKALAESGLVRGEHVGIDSSDIEANASMRSLVHRLTQEQYREWVRSLAAEAGVDKEDDAAVRTFDRHRPGRKTSNEDWHNPHDEDARIGKTKRGNTRMLYKAEHAVDLASGAILDATLRLGNEGDSSGLCARVEEVKDRIKRIFEQGADATAMVSITADKGYYSIEEITALQEGDIETNITRPNWQAPSPKRSAKKRRAVERAIALSSSEEGKLLHRRRGALVERSFAHVLGAGALRRTTLRGRTNVAKRYLLGALCYNLSLLMRALHGIGTPKQALALRFKAFLALFAALMGRTCPPGIIHRHPMAVV